MKCEKRGYGKADADRGCAIEPANRSRNGVASYFIKLVACMIAVCTMVVAPAYALGPDSGPNEDQLRAAQSQDNGGPEGWTKVNCTLHTRPPARNQRFNSLARGTYCEVINRSSTNGLEYYLDYSAMIVHESNNFTPVDAGTVLVFGPQARSSLDAIFVNEIKGKVIITGNECGGYAGVSGINVVRLEAGGKFQLFGPPIGVTDSGVEALSYYIW